MVEIRALWFNCLRGDADALKQQDVWHQKHPELDNKFAEFCLAIERI